MVRMPWKLIGAACIAGGVFALSMNMAKGGGIIFAGALFILIGYTGGHRS